MLENLKDGRGKTGQDKETLERVGEVAFLRSRVDLIEMGRTLKEVN